METLYYLNAAIAVIATALAVTRTHAVHALLNLVVSLLALALIFFLLGAPFAAALQLIVYAGAIMVLFVFVIMMLTAATHATPEQRCWLRGRAWLGPIVLCTLLLIELGYLLLESGIGAPGNRGVVSAETVGGSLFGPYLIAVELASLLLLAGLVGACHLGMRGDDEERSG
ncbi:MAG: NADH-quinone oxidoreductase subunit J [Gammaproteobacteria bacterium]|nr:NADH-quinone oxidoreductase subunit J [Gammaproteobacteria bacterium]